MVSGEPELGKLYRAYHDLRRYWVGVTPGSDRDYQQAREQAIEILRMPKVQARTGSDRR